MTQSFLFGDWVWNPNTLELRNGLHVATLEPRVAKLFEYMVAHQGELLSRDHLIDTVWEGRVVSDEALRRAVFSLRQALAVDGGENYIRTIHKKGYIATFPEPVTALPDAQKKLSTAPLTDTPPIDVVTTAPVVPIHGKPTPAPPKRRLLLLGVLLIVAVVAAVLARVDKMWRNEPVPTHTEIPVPAPATIALLPFINISEDETSQLLTDGLTDELFGTLERNRQLRVTARSSAFQFREQPRDVRDVGQRLGVRYVLEGSVAGNADDLKVIAQLVDAQSGTQLWTETYERPRADWFSLQQDVTLDAARAMQYVLQQEDQGLARPGRARSEEAQLELLRARQLLITRSVADAERAIEHLQKALTLDPNYALAYARLADAILIQAESTTGIRTARPTVAPLLDKALALDPSLGEAYALRSRLTDDPAAAERDLRRGLELNPSYARGYEMLADLQSVSPEKLGAALISIDHAIALDPLTPGNFQTKAVLMMRQGYWSEASAAGHRALELNPQFRAALVLLGMTLALEGHFAEAIEHLERALALDPRAVPLRDQLMNAYLVIGDNEAARTLLTLPGIDTAHALGTPSTVIGQLQMLWADGNVEQAANLIYQPEFGPVELLTTEAVSQIVLLQAVSDKAYTRAATLLSTAFAYTESLPEQTFGWSLYKYVNLVQLLAASGETSAASRLQEQIEERMLTHESRFPRYVLLYDQMRAVLLAHAGDSEAACAALERTYTPNPRPYWRVIMNNPAFDNMRSVPCYKALLARFEAHTAAERARIDEMRRAGKIPDRSTVHSADGTDTAS